MTHGKEPLCIIAPTFSIFGLSTKTFFLNTSSWSQLSRDSFKFSVAPIVTSQFSSEKNFPKNISTKFEIFILLTKYFQPYIFSTKIDQFSKMICVLESAWAQLFNGGVYFHIAWRTLVLVRFETHFWQPVFCKNGATPPSRHCV